MQQAYDLFLFIGQSNMAGRGVSSPRWPEGAPELTPGAGFEYRSVSTPEQLFPIQEPFGAAENDPNGIFEPGMKTGSLVTAFVNAYYAQTHTPIIGVSASKGGSAISAWQGQNDYLSDALARLQRAQCYMQQHGLPLRHCFALWCQGETDGDLGTPAPVYRQKMEQMLEKLHHAGVETCFLITIGEYNGPHGYDYAPIRRVQLEMADSLPGLELVCDLFHAMRAKGLMKDDFHYYQAAYNQVGTAAGAAAARFVQNDTAFKK